LSKIDFKNTRNIANILKKNSKISILYISVNIGPCLIKTPPAWFNFDWDTAEQTRMSDLFGTPKVSLEIREILMLQSIISDNLAMFVLVLPNI
jgi:hypothetical protein